MEKFLLTPRIRSAQQIRWINRNLRKHCIIRILKDIKAY